MKMGLAMGLNRLAGGVVRGVLGDVWNTITVLWEDKKNTLGRYLGDRSWH